MRYCVNCGFSYSDDERYCSRCGYILRSRVISSPVSTVNEARLSQPVEFVSSSSRSISRPRPSRRFPSLFLGLSFISLGLLFMVIFFRPSLFGSFFGSLGCKFGDLGSMFGSFAGDLGGKFGDLGGEMGRSFGNLGGTFGRLSLHGSSFLRFLIIFSVLALFVIPGIFILFRSRRHNSTPNIRWD